MGSTILLKSFQDCLKVGLAILLLCSTFCIQAQSVSFNYVNSNVDYLQVNYEHQWRRHHLSSGVLFHINTTIDDDFISLYLNDFHAFKPSQYFGASLGYNYQVFTLKYAKIFTGIESALFPSLGMKRYSLSRIGINPYGRVIYAMDKISIENGSYVLPINLQLRVDTKLSDYFSLTLAAGLGILINGDFSNSQNVFITEHGQGAQFAVNSFISGGIRYNWHKTTES